MLVDAWEQCRDADVLIESPPAMAGVHIAEALSMYPPSLRFAPLKLSRYPILPRVYDAMVENVTIPPPIHQPTRRKFCTLQRRFVSERCAPDTQAAKLLCFFFPCSYVLFDNVFWLGTSKQINKWRKKHLGLRSTDMGHLAQAKIPFLYNFSPVCYLLCCSELAC